MLQFDGPVVTLVGVFHKLQCLVYVPQRSNDLRLISRRQFTAQNLTGMLGIRAFNIDEVDRCAPDGAQHDGREDRKQNRQLSELGESVPSCSTGMLPECFP